MASFIPGRPPMGDDEDVQPLSNYGQRPMSNLAPVPGYEPPMPPINDTIIAQRAPQGGGSRLGGLGGLAALIGAAIAGPKSGVGNMLAGGVSKYAQNRIESQRAKRATEMKQQDALVDSIMGDLREVSSALPDDPEVGEIQRMYQEALEGDNVISAKEAADISTAIARVRDRARSTSSERKASEQFNLERKQREEQENRTLYETLQATNPAISGIPYDEAKNSVWFKETIGKERSRRRSLEQQKRESSEATVPVKVSGREVNIPALEAYKQEQERAGGLERARVMGANQQALAGTRHAGQAGLQDDRQQAALVQEIVQAVAKNPLLIMPTKRDGTPNPFFNPVYARVMEDVQRQNPNGMSSPPPVQPQGGSGGGGGASQPGGSQPGGRDQEGFRAAVSGAFGKPNPGPGGPSGSTGGAMGGPPPSQTSGRPQKGQRRQFSDGWYVFDGMRYVKEGS